jgi:DNA gyrase subunit A
LQSRGGLGIINIQTSDRNGRVVGVAYVVSGDELMLISQQGKVIRLSTDDIRVIGRATQGVRLIETEENDKVVSIARLEEDDEQVEGEGTQPPPDNGGV